VAKLGRVKRTKLGVVVRNRGERKVRLSQGM